MTSHPQNAPPTIVLLPGLDGGTSLARRFVACLPPGLVSPLELPPDIRLTGLALEQWIAQRLPRDAAFVLLGQSYTAPLTLSLAHLHAACGLILVAPPLFRGPRWGVPFALRSVPKFLLRIPPPAFAVRWLLLGQDAPADLVNEFSRAALAVSPIVLADRVRELSRLLLQKEIPDSPCPTLCLHAEQDGLLTGAIPTTTDDHIQHVTLRGPHLLLARSPEAVAAEVTAFLATLTY